MKRKINKTKYNARRMTAFPQVARILAFAGVFAFTAISAPQAMADDEYEWDSTWGLHEEEWYDPSDWFNEDNTTDYEYDDSYYSSDVWDGYDYYSDYSYDYSGYDSASTGYDYYYQWSPLESDWSETKGDKSVSTEKRDEALEMSKDKKKKSMDKKDVLTMKGTIKSVGKAKAKDGDKEHTFVVIEASEGKTVLVDFGPKAMVGKIKLEKGNKIQVRGPRTKLGGKYVLVAQQVSAINPDKK
jgi:hypothetical protein